MTQTKVKKLLGKIVEVCWGDAHSIDPWTPIDSDDLILEPLPCRTYGVVAGVSDRGVMISASVNGATDVGGSWFIPLGMIDQISILTKEN